MKDQTKELKTTTTKQKQNNGRTLLNITSSMLVSNMIFVAINDNIGGAPAGQIKHQEPSMLSRKMFLLAIFFCSVVQGWLNMKVLTENQCYLWAVWYNVLPLLNEWTNSETKFGAELSKYCILIVQS